MLALALIVCGMLALAAPSAIVAYRVAGSRRARTSRQGRHRPRDRVTLLVLVLLVAIAMSFVMNDASDGSISKRAGAHTVRCRDGRFHPVVLWYTLWSAPRKLAEKHVVGRAGLPRLPAAVHGVHAVLGHPARRLGCPSSRRSPSRCTTTSAGRRRRHEVSRNSDLVATAVDQESASAEERIAI